MDNLVLISKKNMANDDFDCELQNENVNQQEQFFSFEHKLYFKFLCCFFKMTF